MTERELDNTEVISVGLGEWREGHDGDKLITEAAELVAQSRQFVEEAMQYIGIPRESIHINWAADYISAGMALDCTTGSCDISFSTSLSR
jgi:hypothetical protein